MPPLPDIDQLKAEIPEGTALDRLAAATLLADRLRARGDELLDHFVEAARANGASWSEIDLKAKLWTIPAGRMKDGRAHRVPLSKRAEVVVQRLAQGGVREHGARR